MALVIQSRALMALHSSRKPISLVTRGAVVPVAFGYRRYLNDIFTHFPVTFY